MLSTRVIPLGQLVVVEIAGRIDAISAPRLKAVLETELQRGRQRIILDMAQVNYMSAAGLRVLHYLFEKTDQVTIACVSSRACEVLQITGLDTVYQLHPTRLDAVHKTLPIVNAHTHLELGWLAQHCPGIGGRDFYPWITDLTTQSVTRRQEPGWEAVYEAAARDGIQQLLDAGTTAVYDIGSRGMSIGPLLESRLWGIAFVEVACPHAEDLDERFKLARGIIDAWRPKERNGMRIGLGIHTPYTVHPSAWEKLLAYARTEALPVSIHAAESRAEYAFLLNDAGPGDDPQGKIAADFPSPHKTPIHYLEDLGALDLKPLLVHAVQVDDADIQRIKASGSTVVHCPRSNVRLRCGRMPLEKYLEQAVPVLMGTDSLASSPSLDVLDEAEFAAALHYEHVKSDVVAALVHQSLPGD